MLGLVIQIPNLEQAFSQYWWVALIAYVLVALKPSMGYLKRLRDNNNMESWDYKRKYKRGVRPLMVILCFPAFIPVLLLFLVYCFMLVISLPSYDNRKQK